MELKNCKGIKLKHKHRGVSFSVYAWSTDNPYWENTPFVIDDSMTYLKIQIVTDGGCTVDSFFAIKILSTESVHDSRLAINDMLILNANRLVDRFILNN